MRNLATALFRHERIETTSAKAKELRPGRKIQDRQVLGKLFDDIAPRFTERPGGYTRILKVGNRKGDAAEMSLIELVS
jgi:large subunit ribosomal protein L17